jgi:uncharacterized protein
MYSRILNLTETVQRRSLFLFGPRATGKSTFLRSSFPTAAYFDLLDVNCFGRLLKNHKILEEETKADQLVVVDEIQKLPSLLDTVHSLIANSDRKFILTGSSSRKLKRGAANLLAGRARLRNFFPLVSREIPNFDLLKYLNSGGLPQLYGQHDASEDLRAYISLYLKEEIQAEAVTRNVQGFGNLLDALALQNGKELNFQTLGRDLGLPGKTVSNYIEILEDTLLGFKLPAFRNTLKRKPTAHAKFYYFDVGVARELAQITEIKEKSTAFGEAFEHFLIQEIRAYLSYSNKSLEMTFWRTASGFEVDLVVGKKIAIEIKATDQVSDRHLKGLRALAEEGAVERYVCVSLDPSKRTTSDGINIFPIENFLTDLWENKIV